MAFSCVAAHDSGDVIEVDESVAATVVLARTTAVVLPGSRSITIADLTEFGEAVSWSLPGSPFPKVELHSNRLLWLGFRVMQRCYVGQSPTIKTKKTTN